MAIPWMIATVLTEILPEQVVPFRLVKIEEMGERLDSLETRDYLERVFR